MASNGRKPVRRRWLRRLLLGLGILGTLAFAVWRVYVYFDFERLQHRPPIEYVRVEGAIWNLDAGALQAAVAPHARAGFFEVDLGAIEAEVRKFPWVQGATAERVWPNTVIVRIEEQQALARWGEDSLLNVRGERFAPADVSGFEGLPLLEGPPGEEQRVLAMLHALNGKLEARRVQVVALSLSKRLAWVARTADGVEIVFGNQDPLAAMDRLLALLPQLGEERIARIQRLDLRYPNGFSVVWKHEVPLPPETVPDMEHKSRNG